MNRREFLKRMFQAGLVVAAPKLIFDLGANKHHYENQSGTTKEKLNAMFRSVFDVADVYPDVVILSHKQFEFWKAHIRDHERILALESKKISHSTSG